MSFFKIKIKAVLFILFAGLHIAHSQTPTWSSDIAGLFYKNCTSCHNSNGIAPFALIDYTQAFNKKSSILSAVMEKHMPPWPPDEMYRKHAFSRALSAVDIDKIRLWVDAGAPEGDKSKTPKAPIYDNLGFIKNPDLTISTPSYTIGSAVDEYRCFPDSTRLTKDMWMTALECIPGNPSIVHHILIFRDKGTRSYTLDNREAGPGYTCFGGAGTNDAELLAAWVPGSGPFSLPKGFGMKIPARSNIIIQVHYPAGSKGKTDQTVVKFKLTDQPQRETFLVPALNHASTMVNGPLSIPANTIKTFNQKLQIPLPATIAVIGVAPHMHLIGTSIKTWATDLANKEIPLVSIPHWDFHWQGIYQFPKLIKIPFGSSLHSTAVYNNTKTNHHNPNNPPVDVHVGEATTDEMMITYFLFAIYQEGDENKIIDSAAALTTPIRQLSIDYESSLIVYPNPIAQQSPIRFDLNTLHNGTIQVSLFDIQGKQQYQNNLIKIVSGKNQIELKVANLPSGIYSLQIVSAKGITSEKIFIF